MLTDLRIENFRGIRNLSLPKASRVNLVVGRNDSGKTSVLEAIRILQSGDPRHLRRANRSRFERRAAAPEAQFLLSFHRGDDGNPIVIEGSFGDLSLKATAAFAELSDGEQFPLDLEDSDDESSESLLERGREIVVKVQANGGPTATISVPLLESSFLRGVSRNSFFASKRMFSKGSFPSVPPLVWLGTNRIESWAHAQRYSAIYRSGGESSLLQVLLKIEPTLEGLVVLTERAETSGTSRPYAVLEAKLMGQSPLPLESMGEGFTSIISVVSAIASSKGGLCLIDEIENGIHYSILPDVWTAILETAQNCESEVWATTHSLDCVAAAHMAFAESPEVLSVHRLERKGDGQINLHTFDFEMLGRALERGLEVR